jgi:hypothetical protein
MIIHSTRTPVKSNRKTNDQQRHFPWITFGGHARSEEVAERSTLPCSLIPTYLADHKWGGPSYCCVRGAVPVCIYTHATARPSCQPWLLVYLWAWQCRYWRSPRLRRMEDGNGREEAFYYQPPVLLSWII